MLLTVFASPIVFRPSECSWDLAMIENREERNRKMQQRNCVSLRLVSTIRYVMTCDKLDGRE